MNQLVMSDPSAQDVGQEPNRGPTGINLQVGGGGLGLEDESDGFDYEEDEEEEDDEEDDDEHAEEDKEKYDPYAIEDALIRRKKKIIIPTNKREKSQQERKLKENIRTSMLKNSIIPHEDIQELLKLQHALEKKKKENRSRTNMRGGAGIKCEEVKVLLDVNSISGGRGQLEAPPSTRPTDPLGIFDQDPPNTCYAHSAARCLVSILQQAYFPKYNSSEVARKLYENIVGHILEHFNTDGGNVEEALLFCLGRPSPKIKESSYESPRIDRDFDGKDLFDLANCLDIRVYSRQNENVIVKVLATKAEKMNEFISHKYTGAPVGTLIDRSEFISRIKLALAAYRQPCLDFKSSPRLDGGSSEGHAINIETFNCSENIFTIVDNTGERFHREGRFHIPITNLLENNHPYFDQRVVDVVIIDEILPENIRANIYNYFEAVSIESKR